MFQRTGATVVKEQDHAKKESSESQGVSREPELGRDGKLQVVAMPDLVYCRERVTRPGWPDIELT